MLTLFFCFRISYCSADATNSRVFAFIASNSNETIECHAFLCTKRKVAHAVTLTVARAFSMAYEAWRVLPTKALEKHAEATKTLNYPMNNTQIIDTRQQLINFDDFPNNNFEDKRIANILPRPKQNDWVSKI